MKRTKLPAKLKTIIVISLLLSFLNTIAQEKDINQIVAEGSAKMKVKPDFVSFTLTVEKTDTSERIVLEKLNHEVESLAKTLYKIGFTNNAIRIADYNVSSSFNNKDKNIYSIQYFKSRFFY